MVERDDELMWPTTFEEQNLAGDVHIRPEDIASYAYPPGERERYTYAGWRKAIELGVATVRRLEDFPEVTRLLAIERAARSVMGCTPLDREGRIYVGERWDDLSRSLESLRAALYGKGGGG